MKISRCKGSRDLMPWDMKKIRSIEQAFLQTCSSWGYKEIKTPTIEYLHLFTSAGTLSPSMLSQVYSFLDWDGWSGERVVLRPDGTIPAARFFVENLSDVPVARLCYVENMFSFVENAQDSREQWQCGAELVGSSEPEGETELLMLALDVLKKLNVEPVQVKLSHIGLLNALLEDLGITEEERSGILSEILTGNFEILDKYNEQYPDIERFHKLMLELQGTSKGFLENLRSLLPDRISTIGPFIDGLSQIAELFDSIGQDYQIDFAAGAGFEYYTGVIFQLYISGELVGKGGRYDELISLVGGESVPAGGFALFTDKIILRNVKEASPPPEKILLTSRPRSIGGMKYPFEIARTLREKGFVVEIDSGPSDGADCRWIVSLSRKGDSIIHNLMDKTTGKESANLSTEQLWQRLEEVE